MSEEKDELQNETIKKFTIAEDEMWNKFSDFQQFCNENVKKINTLQNALSEKQFTHEKEFRDYQASVGENLAVLHKTIEDLKREVLNKTTEAKTATDKYNRQQEHVNQLERENQSMQMLLKEQQQSNRHIEDRIAVATTQRKVAELRQQELEASVEYAMNISRKLRKSLEEVDLTKQRALQEQYTVFQAEKKKLMEYYETRELNSRNEFTNAIKEIQQNMIASLKEREEQLAKEWELKEVKRRKEHEEQNTALERRKNTLETEYRNAVANFEREKEVWIQQKSGEFDDFMRRAKEREQWVMQTVNTREMRVAELEEQFKSDRGKWDKETETRLLKKEEELRQYYEGAMESMRKSFEQEREKLSDTFTQQLQRITNLHVENERELERLHREKERELSAYYRPVGTELHNHPSEMETDASLPQSSLLARFDQVESQRNERAKKLRLALNEGNE